MWFRTATVLLTAWGLGVAGLYRIGDMVHLFLLLGGLCLLLGVTKARDAAVARQREDDRSRKHP